MDEETKKSRMKKKRNRCQITGKKKQKKNQVKEPELQLPRGVEESFLFPAPGKHNQTASQNFSGLRRKKRKENPTRAWQLTCSTWKAWRGKKSRVLTQFHNFSSSKKCMEILFRKFLEKGFSPQNFRTEPRCCRRGRKWQLLWRSRNRWVACRRSLASSFLCFCVFLPVSFFFSTGEFSVKVAAESRKSVTSVHRKWEFVSLLQKILAQTRMESRPLTHD